MSTLVGASAVACGLPDEPSAKSHDSVTSSANYDVDALIADLRAYDAESRASGTAPQRNAFLARLPEPFKRRYTILHASAAEDPVDEKDPTDGRVLAFGDTAELTIAWTRDSKDFQVAQHRGSRLELRKVEFLPTGISISKANPAGCGSADCHGENEQDPRYRWDAYPSWPKAFAADNDFVKPGAEEARVRKFFDNAATHPAFSMLVRDFEVPGTIGTFRIGSPGAREGAPSGKKAATTGYADGTSALSYQFRPNTFLTLAYARMHAEQLFGKLKANKAYTTYEYPLLFVLSRCEWPSTDTVGRDAVNASLAATSKPKTAPRIDVGRDPSKWMPWFEFLGLDADRMMLSDDRPLAAVGGLRQDHLYNEGFTSLAYFIGGRISENIAARRADWKPMYLKGQNQVVESKLFGNLAYENKAALLSQVKTLDALGSFLDVEPRSYLEQARDKGHAERAGQACDAIRAVVRQQFRLE